MLQKRKKYKKKYDKYKIFIIVMHSSSGDPPFCLENKNIVDGIGEVHIIVGNHVFVTFMEYSRTLPSKIPIQNLGMSDVLSEDMFAPDQANSKLCCELYLTRNHSTCTRSRPKVSVPLLYPVLFKLKFL